MINGQMIHGKMNLKFRHHEMGALKFSIICLKIKSNFFLFASQISKINWLCKALKKENSTVFSNSWLLVSHSAIGRQHVKNKTACQDFHFLIEINAEMGIAVVCDGAGSAPESARGAKIVAKQTAKALERRLKTPEWFPPNQEIWQKSSRDAFMEVRSYLTKFAKRTNIDLKFFACTVIAVIYHPKTLLISHIGDGRAAYCNSQNQWFPIMTPFKGEEANQTMFITCDGWCNNSENTECKVILDDITAFTLMSDGCEKHAFIINRKDDLKNIYYTLNEPYADFFNPLTSQLLALDKLGYSQNEINTEWQNFLEIDHEGLAKESDDKTLILGILKV